MEFSSRWNRENVRLKWTVFASTGRGAGGRLRWTKGVRSGVKSLLASLGHSIEAAIFEVGRAGCGGSLFGMHSRVEMSESGGIENIAWMAERRND